MQALVLEGGSANILDVPSPERAPGEALLRVRVSGVCDTDLQLARGYMGFRGVPGHELVGEVIASEDDTRWKGKRVVADINAGCGVCDDCLRGGAVDGGRGGLRGHHCSKRTVLGILGRSGSFAELVAVPERCLVEVPASLDDDHAVFAEPLAAALHVLDELDEIEDSDSKDRRAVVLGDGKLGQLIARALASGGVATTLVGHHTHKLERVRRDAGAGAGIETFLEADLPTSHRNAPLVVEATGSEGGLGAALAIVRPRGTVVLKTTVAAKLSVDLAPIVINELRVVGSRCGDMARAIDALATGRIDPSSLVEARYPLSRAVEAFEHAGRRGAMKILVDI